MRTGGPLVAGCAATGLWTRAGDTKFELNDGWPGGPGNVQRLSAAACKVWQRLWPGRADTETI
jgi:hypothetical protein